MSEWSGSYRRFEPSEVIPSYRPQNNNLARNLVPDSELTRHKRIGVNASDRDANKFADFEKKRTDHGREDNVGVGGSIGSDLGGFVSSILPFIL